MEHPPRRGVDSEEPEIAPLQPADGVASRRGTGSVQGEAGFLPGLDGTDEVIDVDALPDDMFVFEAPLRGSTGAMNQNNKRAAMDTALFRRRAAKRGKKAALSASFEQAESMGLDLSDKPARLCTVPPPNPRIWGRVNKTPL